MRLSWKATSPSAEDRLTVSQRSVEEGFRRQRHQNESARGAQPSQSDRDEPADRGLGGQAASCSEGVETVAGKLVRRDIIPNVAGLCSLDQQVSNQVDELLLRPGDVLTSVQECRKFGTVVLTLVGDRRRGKGVVRCRASSGCYEEAYEETTNISHGRRCRHRGSGSPPRVRDLVTPEPFGLPLRTTLLVGAAAPVHNPDALERSPRPKTGRAGIRDRPRHRLLRPGGSQMVGGGYVSRYARRLRPPAGDARPRDASGGRARHNEHQAHQG